jgi:PAS domain S-box-containing protein
MNLTISKRQRSLLIQYGTAILATLVATLLRKVLDPILQQTAPFSVYYAAVMFTAWYAGFRPSLLCLLLGAVLADCLFIEPHHSILDSNLEHQVGLALYIAVGVFVSLLSELLHASRRRTEAAHAELAKAHHELQREIADRKRAEAWLLESEQRFRGCFEQGLVGMAILSEKRDWIEVNQLLCRMLGYSETELTSKLWSELVHPDDLDAEETLFHQIVQGPSHSYIKDQRFLRKDGQILRAGLNVKCLRNSDGRVDCLLVLIQDLTKQKTSKDALQVALQ